jgi:RNA polymerase sigma factor (sigma-70 family)
MASTEAITSETAERRFIRRAMKAPLLAADHEHDLAKRWREENDEDALHELTGAYMRLVVAMAGKFRAYGLPMGDLVQEGAVGLMQAAARFEPERGVRFSTYAGWWVRAAMQDYVLRNWSIVRTGTTAAGKSLFFNLRRLRARLGDMEGRLTAAARTQNFTADCPVIECCLIELIDMRCCDLIRQHALVTPAFMQQLPEFADRRGFLRQNRQSLINHLPHHGQFVPTLVQIEDLRMGNRIGHPRDAGKAQHQMR